MPKYQYGWKKQNRDDRDLMYSIAKPIAGLPATSDLRNQFPPCYDQGQTSSCTGNGTVGELQSAQFHAGLPIVMLSRLFAYYNGRMIEGGADQDGGANIRDVIKGCNQYGIVEESLWPFSESAVTTQPTPEVYDKAVTDPIHFYASVDLTNVDNIKVALGHKLPVVFGFQVYDFFESPEMVATGILNMPTSSEQFLGGHCVVICGHDDSEKMFWVRNSWGPGWGPFNGYFKMSYDYVTSNLCSDGWVIRLK
jgi:C1A family cysteine protease